MRNWMTRRLRPWLLVALWLCGGMLLSPSAQAEVAIPVLKTYVTDLTRTLTPNQQDALVQLLKNLDTRKGSQIAVLIVATTQPELEPV